MPKVKYMGSADVRKLAKGETFGGRLADGLESELVFDRSNYWIVDTDELDLSEEAVQLLLEEDDFKDVSDAKRIPDNEHQKLFMARKGAKVSVDAEEVPVTAGASVTGGDTATTTGGSTEKATGAAKKAR
jgi:hypothetical protein